MARARGLVPGAEGAEQVDLESDRRRRRHEAGRQGHEDGVLGGVTGALPVAGPEVERHGARRPRAGRRA